MKALLDSGTTEILINREFAAKHGFKLLKLEKPIQVQNVDEMLNKGEAITHEIKVNVYYKNHVKRMKMDICSLGKVNVILGMPCIKIGLY